MRGLLNDWRLAVCAGFVASIATWPAAAVTPESTSTRAPALSLDPATETRILALSPERITEAEVRDVLSHAPAPRIICLQGSIALVTMRPFAEFLIAMGYPASRLRHPVDGSLSQSSFTDSDKLAGMLAWYYENEGMMPMLIGHSQGGMLTIKVLYELSGEFEDKLNVWNPLNGEKENRTTIIDPLDGVERPVVGLKVPYAASLATGRLLRVLFGQWEMVSRLRAIPDSVDEFTGFIIEWDPIAMFGSEPYHATGTAQVRTVVLPASTSHIAMPKAKALADNALTRAWIDQYRPGDGTAPPEDAGIDTSNIVHAADIWYSVKKHWCIEAQKLIRARHARDEAKSRGG
ncbi:MAG TPA: hypothetical protein VKG21_04700 [Casimicrobiaceae bacterium]|nr:hypothetical protein [Casimicrobiaceae bacterium]